MEKNHLSKVLVIVKSLPVHCWWPCSPPTSKIYCRHIDPCWQNKERSALYWIPEPCSYRFILSPKHPVPPYPLLSDGFGEHIDRLILKRKFHRWQEATGIPQSPENVCSLYCPGKQYVVPVPQKPQRLVTVYFLITSSGSAGSRFHPLSALRSLPIHFSKSCPCPTQALHTLPQSLGIRKRLHI